MRPYSFEIPLHILIISIFLVVINIPIFDLSIGIFSTGNYSFVWPSVAGTLINCAIFYGNSNYLIPKFLSLHRRSFYVFLLVTSFILLTILEVFIDYGLALFADINVSAKGAWVDIIVLAVLVNMLTLLASFAYRFTKDWFYHEHLQRKLNEEKLAAELAFLKSQVNPHFLFNTLNNLFSSAMQHKDEVTADGIRRLASLMRYMLHESNTEYIELSKELEYINNYIELQRLRFGERMENLLKIKVEGNPESILISPMLFIPFIENAFKHGISLSSASPITINFKILQKSVYFSIKNKVNTLRKREKDEYSGVGLVNIKKRLALLYPDKHALEIDTIEDEFIVNLTIYFP